MRRQQRIPSRVYGRTQPGAAGSDEGCRGLVGTSRGPSSGLASRRILLPQVGEGCAPAVFDKQKSKGGSSPVHGRRWPREAKSDEGRRDLVGTSLGPSSGLASRRHLLPQVGEGFAPSSRAFGYRGADHVEGDVAAADHQFVAKPEEAIAMFAQPGVARGVASFLLVAIMRRAVEFDREAMPDAEEIHDIAADGNLPAEFQPVARRRAATATASPRPASSRAEACGRKRCGFPRRGRAWRSFAEGVREGKRGAAPWWRLPSDPHPTPLRGATFSHKWEKDARPSVRQPKKQGRSFSRLREKVASRSEVG